MLTIQTNQLTTTITLCNYNTLQGGENENELPESIPNEKQTRSKRTTNNNDNNDNKLKHCLDYFNKTTGREFKNGQGLEARLKEYSVDDIKKVIDYKTKEWKGKTQEKYLRPETLFRPGKFEGYLNDARNEVPTKASANQSLEGIDYGQMEGNL